MVHKTFREKRRSRDTFFSRVLSPILTFHFVCFGWIFFRASSFGTAFDMLKQIFTSFHGSLVVPLVSGYTTVFIIMALGYVSHFVPRQIEAWTEERVAGAPIVVQSLLLAGAIWLVVQFRSSAVQPFIYLQF